MAGRSALEGRRYELSLWGGMKACGRREATLMWRNRVVYLYRVAQLVFVVGTGNVSCIWRMVSRAGRCSFEARAHLKPVGAVASTVGVRADRRVLPAALSASHLFAAKGANIVYCSSRLSIYSLADGSMSRKLFAKLPFQHCSGCGAC